MNICHRLDALQRRGLGRVGSVGVEDGVDVVAVAPTHSRARYAVNGSTTDKTLENLCETVKNSVNIQRGPRERKEKAFGGMGRCVRGMGTGRRANAGS